MCVSRDHKFIRACVLGVIVSACVGIAFSQAQDAESAKKGIYTVKGYRHGVSFFKDPEYPETKPLKQGEVDFRHYHTYGETLSLLKKWASDYPDLVDLVPSGQSYEGRDIMQVTLTNKKTGRDSDKPAMALDGNRHSGEVASAECVLWMIDHLLTNFGKDEAITHLLDTKAMYFRPNNNPDGSELYLHSPLINRSTVRPHDSDGDGLLDEDSEEDLDGDGFVRQMRIRVEPGEGNSRLDPRDPTGRLMTRERGGQGDWLVYSEGLDNDGDGRFNEDGIGGLDLHRNYIENWRPEPGLDVTGRGWTQRGAGEYPLSEPECLSFFLFLMTHPNISIVNSMDTYVPMHLHGPSTSRKDDRMYSEDLIFFDEFDEQGKKITGYPYSGDTYFDAPNKTRPAPPSPIFGHGPDFGYWYYGSIWYGDELWNAGRMKDYDGDGTLDNYDVLCWNDEALAGRGFKNWAKFDHPQLGEVEIGGFNPKFLRQNPPPELLEEWIRKEGLFNLYLAQQLPQIEISAVEVKAGDVPGVFDLTVKFTNTGHLPTALEQAKLVKIVKPDTVRLEFEGSRPGRSGRGKVEILLPETGERELEMGWTQSGETKTARFKVKLNGLDSIPCTVHVLSTRGGHKTRVIPLGATKD